MALIQISDIKPPWTKQQIYFKIQGSYNTHNI